MEVHKGTLTAVSVPGQGASMVLEFPCGADGPWETENVEGVM